MNKHITIVIDEKTHDFISAVFQAHPDKLIVELMKKYDAREAGFAFLEAMSEGGHKNGWCKDPNCPVKQGNA